MNPFIMLRGLNFSPILNCLNLIYYIILTWTSVKKAGFSSILQDTTVHGLHRVSYSRKEEALEVKMCFSIFLISIIALISSEGFTFQPGRILPGSISRRHDTKTTFLVWAKQGKSSSATALSTPVPPSEKPRPLNSTMLNGEDVEDDANFIFIFFA